MKMKWKKNNKNQSISTVQVGWEGFFIILDRKKIEQKCINVQRLIDANFLLSTVEGHNNLKILSLVSRSNKK